MPFFFLISQPVKRNRVPLMIGALWMLAIHYVDIYWLVMPTLHHEAFKLSLLDLTCWLGVGGLFFAVLGYLMQHNALVPVRDPRLPEFWRSRTNARKIGPRLAPLAGIRHATYFSNLPGRLVRPARQLTLKLSADHPSAPLLIEARRTSVEIASEPFGNRVRLPRRTTLQPQEDASRSR